MIFFGENMQDKLSVSQLAKIVKGTFYGNDKKIEGNYTFLNEAKSGDIVIRHWINSKGIEIAKNRGVSCIITQNPEDDAVDVAIKLDLPLIVTKNIEYATAYAIKSSVRKYANKSFRVAVTGTNGKSTTTHLLYTIFNDLGFVTYTNTDAESEGNTLIDPRVSSELTRFYLKNNKIDVIALEVSEVQGWDDRLMKNHSLQMISALEPDALIITNASADHMNLVESFDELLDEISGAAKALRESDKNSVLVLNYDDVNIRKMGQIVELEDNIQVMYFGEGRNDSLNVYYVDNMGIYVSNELYIGYDDLPFTSKHFIQDIMAAIAVCEYKHLNRHDVADSLRKYNPLARRFVKLKENPVIIDDFAHNPSGIKLTIENGASLGNKVYVVDAIRGSRGVDINEEIAEALVESLSNLKDYELILTTSTDVVNNLNTVTDKELESFTRLVEKNNITYTLYETLEQSLIDTVNKAKNDDVILLLGAQGMDPAKNLLNKNNII